MVVVVVAAPQFVRHRGRRADRRPPAEQGADRGDAGDRVHAGEVGHHHAQGGRADVHTARQTHHLRELDDDDGRSDEPRFESEIFYVKLELTCGRLRSISFVRFRSFDFVRSISSFDFVRFRSISFDFVRFRSISFNLVQFSSFDFLRSILFVRFRSFDFVRFRSISFDFVRFRSISFDFVRFRSISFDLVQFSSI